MNQKRNTNVSLSNISEDDNFQHVNTKSKLNNGSSCIRSRQTSAMYDQDSPDKQSSTNSNQNEQINEDIGKNARTYLYKFLDSIGNNLKNEKVNIKEIKDQLSIKEDPIQTFNDFIHLYENDIKKMETNKQKKKNWNKDDIQLLIWIVYKYCKYHGLHLRNIKKESDWEKIAKIVPGKDTESCKFKWFNLTKQPVTQSPWSEEEKDYLRELVKIHDTEWVQISKFLYQKMANIDENTAVFRTSKQCREHYNNFLDPALNKSKWTEEEDRKLIQLQKELGNKWSEISKQIPGRTDNFVKNRYQTIKNRQSNKLIGKQKSSSSSSEQHNNQQQNGYQNGNQYNQNGQDTNGFRQDNIQENMEEEEKTDKNGQPVYPHHQQQYQQNNFYDEISNQNFITKQEEEDQFFQQSRDRKEDIRKKVEEIKTAEKKYENDSSDEDEEEFESRDIQDENGYIQSNNIQIKQGSNGETIYNINNQEIKQNDRYFIQQFSKMELSGGNNKKQMSQSQPSDGQVHNFDNYLIPAFIDPQKKIIYLMEEETQWFKDSTGMKQFQFKSQPLSAQQKFQIACQQVNPKTAQKTQYRRSSLSSNKSDNSKFKRQSSLNSENSIHIYPGQYQQEYQKEAMKNNNNDSNSIYGNGNGSPLQNGQMLIEQRSPTKKSIFQQISQNEFNTQHPCENMLVGFPMGSMNSLMELRSPTKLCHSNRFLKNQYNNNNFNSNQGSNFSINNQQQHQQQQQQGIPFDILEDSKNKRNSFWHLEGQSPINQNNNMYQYNNFQSTMNSNQNIPYPMSSNNGPLGSPMHKFFNKSPNNGSHQNIHNNYDNQNQNNMSLVENPLSIGEIQSGQKVPFSKNFISDDQSPLQFMKNSGGSINNNMQQNSNNNQNQNNNNFQNQSNVSKDFQNSPQKYFMNTYYQQVLNKMQKQDQNQGQSINNQISLFNRQQSGLSNQTNRTAEFNNNEQNQNQNKNVNNGYNQQIKDQGIDMEQDEVNEQNSKKNENNFQNLFMKQEKNKLFN